MDIIIVLTILFAFLVAGLIALITMINQRFPQIAISVKNSRIRQIYTYRLLGTTIVADNIFMLLMNNFEICGDIRELDYDLVPNKLFIFTTGYYKLFNAYLRFGYLVGISQPNINVNELQENKPIVWTTKDATMSITKKGILVPFTLQLKNEELKEKEITNGKAICARFIESQRANRQFNDTTNPLFTTLIYSIPLFLTVVGLGIVIYLGLSSAGDSSLKVVDSANLIVAHVDSLTNETNTMIQHMDKLTNAVSNMGK